METLSTEKCKLKEVIKDENYQGDISRLKRNWLYQMPRISDMAVVLVDDSPPKLLFISCIEKSMLDKAKKTASGLFKWFPIIAFLFTFGIRIGKLEGHVVEISDKVTYMTRLIENQQIRIDRLYVLQKENS